MHIRLTRRGLTVLLSVLLVAVLVFASAQIASSQASAVKAGGEGAGGARGDTEMTPVPGSGEADGAGGQTQAASTSQATSTPQAAAGAQGEASSQAAQTTAPAVKSIKLDAKELLFGAKGKKLRLKPTVTPKRAGTDGIVYRSTDESVATVSSKGLVKARGWGTCKIVAKVNGKKAKVKVTVARKWVALTFDDGPGPYTDKLLKAMKKRGVRATFFVVGSMAKSRPGTLKKAVKAGNEIANHTYGHNGSANVLIGSLAKTDSIVKKATGSKTKLMRPPGGAINSVTYRCGKPIIIWSVDPKDWRDRNASTVYSRVMNGTKSGSIVLLHDIHPTSVTAAIDIMDSLKDRGYAFVTVSELLKHEKAGRTYNKGPKKVRTMKIRY